MIFNILLLILSENTDEGRLHLGKIQINLVFRSICTTFAAANIYSSIN
ncbi:hypothetical protein SAMN04487901_1275 [Prevotella communis]|uniref:Uncharacterized protein n=1 Tax=Prevotella communis TaxID=2913614 RepID=A0A1H0FWF9_9BACT|nr:hypothetical protein SAMN04487901_1275 [Prevotella communis]SDN98914.1 hypothetical protein SAMN04487900_106143 [Prevotella communis]